MEIQRLSGYFEWYNHQNGYGVILGDDANEYFAHKSNHPAIPRPERGMKVTFLARPRPKNKQGYEAYDIQARIEDTTRPGLSPDIQDAVQEALRLKRERRLGVADRPAEEFPPGTRVRHPKFGYGTVVLASRDILSIRLENDPQKVVDITRVLVDKAPGVRQKDIPDQKSVAVSPRKSISRQGIFSFGTSINNFVHQMADEVQQFMVKEGIEEDSHYHFEPASEPDTPPENIQVDQRISDAFEKASSIRKFYSHQVRTRQALQQGKHVVISTPTASGKTEAYNPTILETLLADPSATALYVFPLVALGIDQTERLEKLNQELPAGDQLAIGIYNNSVSGERKNAALKGNNRILVTTPDSLHYIFLPKPYPNWKNFYRSLRYVVIDEAHVYKGVLGANMANILRRLLVRCRREGNPQYPQVIISSATVRYPGKLAYQLTGLPVDDFEVILENGAPKPGRHFLVTRSDIHDIETLCSDLLQVTTEKRANEGKRPVSVIVFMRSINEVKQATKNLRENLFKTSRREQVSLVEEYYADKSDKSDVLVRLRDGRLRCLFTTTALMAGIDVGSLDVAIVKGFPGLVMDARQMFGRAGRVREGAVIFIAHRTNPFDQFYFERPELLFNGPIEDVIANPENPILLAAHLQCAAQISGEFNREGPLSGELAALFGQMGRDILDSFVSSQRMRIQSGSYYLTGADPHGIEPLNDIRAISNETYTLTNMENNELLEKKRQSTAFRDAHLNAIVWVGGRTYQVETFDTKARDIQCRTIPQSDLRTRGIEQLEIEICSIDSQKPASEIGLSDGVSFEGGKINIRTSVQSYLLYKAHLVMQCRRRSCRYETPNLELHHCPVCNSALFPKQAEDIVDRYDIPVPPVLQRILETRATWINFPATIKNQFEQEFWPRWLVESENGKASESLAPDFESAIHSCKHAILKAFPDTIVCDRDEIGSHYQANVGSSFDRIILYDNFQGGLGLSDEFFYEPRNVLEEALALIERCTCIDDVGCPICLAYFNCHHNNKSISKLAGRYLLSLLLRQDTQKVVEDLKEYIHLNKNPSQTCFSRNGQ